MKKIPNFVIVSASILVLVIGGVVYFSQRAGESEIIKLKYTVSIGAAAETRAKIIKKYEIDKNNGLDIEFVTMNPGDLERVLFSKEFPIGITSSLAVGTANLKGIPLRIVGPELHLTYYIGVRKDSSINTLDDLKGKKFGILPKVTAAYTSVAVVLNSAGINPETDLQLAFGSIPDVVDLLGKGEVDAAIIAYPMAAPLLVPGSQFRTIVKLEDLWSTNENGLPLPFVVTAAHEDWLASNKETARRLVKTLIEASEFMQKNPSVILELSEYLEERKLTSPEVAQLVAENVPELLFEKWGEEEIAGLERLFQRAEEFGVIPAETPNLTEMLVTPSSLGL